MSLGRVEMATAEQPSGGAEPVVLRARQHAAVLLWHAAFALAVCGVVTLVVQRNELIPSTVVLLWLGGVATIAASAVLPVLRWRRAEFVVTPRVLRVRLGLGAPHGVDLGHVERVEIDRDWAGRLLDYGTVRVIARGGGVETLPGVAHPEALREALLRRPRGIRVR